MSDDRKRPDAEQDAPQQQDEHQLIAVRREKLRAHEQAGNPAYPNDFKPTITTVGLHEICDGQTLEQLAADDRGFSLAGRITALRDHGNTVFLDLLDRSGRLQLYVNRKSAGDELLELAKRLDCGDIVGAGGTAFLTRRGELSLNVSQLRLLSKCLRPWPEKWHGLSDIEARTRQRYLDLATNSDSRETFRIRSRTVTAIRGFLDSRDFIEVETPMMQPIPGGAAARPFVTHHNALDMELYLRVAPELYLKRLLVGNLERVYEINRNFRNEGISTQHNPEFTMLEFYLAYATYTELMELTEQLFAEVAQGVLGRTLITFQDQEIELAPPWQRLTLEQAAVQLGGLPAESVDDRAALVDFCDQHQISVDEDWGSGKLLLEIFEKRVEHKLIQPTFIHGYPVEVSPLARRADERPELTDRFEFFIGGREIGNAFSELNDPVDQAQRFAAQVEARAAGDDEAQPYDEDYIRALEYAMPPAAGEGIGIDRLVQLLTDRASIRDVILFPLLRPDVKGE
ncbi:MAG: lysine--tRNA ligase [Candidatus Alcyoniella australis]|nr:lysine--tRNA ligase [Candidatus Alcyoniella australis]